jgi:hypothetical protein
MLVLRRERIEADIINGRGRDAGNARTIAALTQRHGRFNKKGAPKSRVALARPLSNPAKQNQDQKDDNHKT